MKLIKIEIEDSITQRSREVLGFIEDDNSWIEQFVTFSNIKNLENCLNYNLNPKVDKILLFFYKNDHVL